jgi:hypothetical protein
MENKISWIKKIGNLISNVLLGETKELIVRTDERVQNISRTMTEELRPDVKDMREKFSGIETKVSALWADKYAPSRSPRQLNDKGNAILANSGIKEILDAKKLELLKLIQTKNIKNAYDAEKIILATVAEMPIHYPDIVDKLKQGAFQAGVDIGAILFVGGIYLRNVVFKELGFSLEDLDKPLPEKDETIG